MKKRTLLPRELPMDEEELRGLAWKAWTALEKKLANEGASLMQPSNDAPEFITHKRRIVARFYNSYEYLSCFEYDVARQKFRHSEELTEILCQQELA